MKIAVLADIHGNLEALSAVCADIDRREVDDVVCLGDNVGYGPDPEDVTSLVRDRNFHCVLGNHDFALFDKRARRWLNFQAADNNVATFELLSAESRQYYMGLPMHLCLANGHFVHGYPPSSPFRYLNRQNDAKILHVFNSLPSQIFWVGHTHRLEMVTVERSGISRQRMVQGVMVLDPEQRYLVSAGSVGQPRDGDPQAKYLIWDTEGALEMVYVPYDVELTKEKIKARGFPEVYAMRLG